MPIIGALLLIPGFFSVAGITGVPGLAVHLGADVAVQVRALRDGRLAGVRHRHPLLAALAPAEAVNKVAHIHLEDEGM